MIKNYVASKVVEQVSYNRDFLYDRNSGFSFPCDEKGNILENEMCEDAWANYRYATAHPELFEVFNKLSEQKTRYTEPPKGTCGCGMTVVFVNQYQGACECPRCGKWYNIFGQEVLPPDQWDEGNDY